MRALAKPRFPLAKILSEISHQVKLPKKDSDPAHTLFSYPAKFQAFVPSFIIRSLSQKGDLVLDPFGGGGTTAVCAKSLERSFVHYDLSPFSCLVAKAKTASIGKKDSLAALDLLSEKLRSSSKKLLTKEEARLLGKNVSQAAEHCWWAIEKTQKTNVDLAAILAVLATKLVKVCGRRDASARRKKPAKYHVQYIAKQLENYCQYLSKSAINNRPYPLESRNIYCASNHHLRLKDHSVDMIVTSPPYPGVDVEYAQIQLQRRDLSRCYRSNFPLRIAQSFFGTTAPSKKQLCNGGGIDGSTYSANAQKSLVEMRRVLKKGRMAFVYCGFKTALDQKKYEGLIRKTGFQIVQKSQVLLSNDRVASSRSTHHGAETNMMKRDILFVLN